MNCFKCEQSIEGPAVHNPMLGPRHQTGYCPEDIKVCRTCNMTICECY